MEGNPVCSKNRCSKRSLKYLRKTAFLLIFSLCTFSLECSPLFRKKELNLAALTPTEIINKVEKNVKKLHTLRGWAHVTLESSQNPFNGYSEVLLKTPDSLVVKFKARLGISAAFLSLDRNYFWIYYPNQNKLYWGSPNKAIIKEILEVNFTFEELMEVFTGLPTFAGEDMNFLSDFFLENDKLILVFEDEEGMRRYWVDPWNGVVTHVEWLNSEGVLYLVKEFSQFKKEQSVLLPRLIRIIKPTDRERLTVFYRRRGINKKLAAKDFKVKIPANAEVIEIKASGN